MRKLIFIVLLLGFFSCSDENIRTEGEINAQKLNEIINARLVDNFWVRWSEGDQSILETYSNPDYEIEGSFIRIDSDYYNLAKLKKVEEWGNLTIELLFE